MANDLKKSRRRRVIALTIATLLAMGLFWLFNAGMGDKEGRIKVALAMAKVREAQGAIAAYYAERKMLPPDNSALQLPNKESKPYLNAFEQQTDLSFEILVQSGTLILTFASKQDPVSGKTLVFVPKITNVGLEWPCNSGTVDSRYRPPAQCRDQ